MCEETPNLRLDLSRLCAQLMSALNQETLFEERSDMWINALAYLDVMASFCSKKQDSDMFGLIARLNRHVHIQVHFLFVV